MLIEGLAEGIGQAGARGEHQDEWDRCAADVAYWFDTYVWTYNPKLPPNDRWLPFKLWPKQREYLQWLQERQRQQEDGVVEKSRDVGMTWLNIGYLIHAWLFEPDFKGAIGSRKEDLVDSLGNPDSIFEKGRMILRKLPPWMLPNGFREREHAMFCRLVNPENGSVISGEAGDNIGRGGRNSLYFVDEAAFIERSERVDAALSANADCKIHVSTPNGQGNAFYRKRFSGEYPVFTFRWQDDPRKTPEWYALQVKKLDPVAVAQEIDIDYTASLEGVIIPAKWIQAAVGLELPRSEVCRAGLDVAAGGRNKTVFIARRGPVVTWIDSTAEANTTLTANWAIELAEKFQAAVVAFDGVGVGAGVGSTFALREETDFTPLAIMSGEPASDRVWPDERTSRERFLNLRAELWWLLRTRFEKTYEHVNGLAEHPLDELISIPRNDTLIAQLSTPLYFRTEAGKIRVESKEAMKKRGVDSPDYADALVYAFSDTEPEQDWDL